MTYSDIILEKHFENRILKVYAQRPRSLAQLLQNSVQRFPDKEAVVSESVRLTYAQFSQTVNDMAFTLKHDWKLKKGERVALLLGNEVEFCIALFAITQVGGIAVPLNTRLQTGELEFMLENSGSRLLITNDELYPVIQSIVPSLKALEQVFIVGVNRWENTLPFSSLIEKRADHLVADAAHEDDVIFIMYTSGTTGRPKGAMGTHLGAIHSAINYYRVFATTPEDRTLLVVPLFHVTGLIGQLIHMLYVGGTVVLMKTYKTEHMLELMEKERISFMFVVPTIYVLMLLNPKLKNYDLSSFRLAAYGGAPMSVDTIQRLSETFPALRLHNAYGATETSSPATLLPAEDSLRKASSVGLPVPVGECLVVDENGNPLPPGNVGELWIKGPMVIPGYWANPEANAREFTDGYWHSGDVAMMDNENYVYIMDRKKEMINRGGEKIFCVEVENVLYGHPKVMEAAVVGVPDPVFGEQVKAVVVPRPGESLTAEEIRAYAATKLADFKVPRYVQFVEQLPRNPGGKVIKALLKEIPDVS